MSVGNDGLVHLWDLTSDQGVRLGHSPGDECLALAVSQDGTHAVTGGKDKKLSFWDVTQRKLKIAVPQEDHVLCVAMSSDGKRAASGGRDGIVRIWDSDKGTGIGQFNEHKSSVVAVAISPDGQMAASSSETDSHLPLWNVQTKQVLRRYDTKGVKQLAFTHDGTHLLSRSKSVQLWHVDFMPPLASISSCDGDEVSGFGVAPDDRSILIAGRYVASVVPLPSLTGRGDVPAGELSSFPHSRDTVWAVSDDGSRVLTGLEGPAEFRDGEMPPRYVLWDGNSGLKIDSFEGSVGVSGGCEWIAHYVSGKGIRLVDTRRKVPAREVRVSYFTRAVVSPGGRFILCRGNSKEGVSSGWWDLETEQMLLRIENDFNGVFLGDGQHMLVWMGANWKQDGGHFIKWDGSNWVRDRRSDVGTKLVSLKEGKVGELAIVHSFPIEGRELATCSHDYRYLVGKAEQGRIGVWDTLNGKLLSEIEWPKEFEVQSVSSDGARLAATKYGNVVVLDTKTGRIVRQLKGTCEGRVCFTLDGKHLLVGGNSGLEVWNVDKESRFAALERRSERGSDGGDEELKVLPGGRIAVTVGEGSLVLWKLP